MKRWLRWTILLVLVLPVALVFLPTFLAQRSVRDWLVQEILAKEGAAAELDEVQLGWFTPTQVKGLSLGPVDRPRLIHIDGIRSDRTFWSGLWEGIDVGDLVIERPQIHLWFEGQQSNLDFHPGPKAPDDPQAEEVPPPATTLNLLVYDAELWINTHTMPSEVLVCQDVDLRGTLSKNNNRRLLTLTAGPLLDHAKLSPELCAGGLKYIVPVLAEATWTKGELSLHMDDCVIDLDDPTQSRISGKLRVHGIEAGIKNQLIAEAGERLAKLMGREGSNTIHLVDNSVVSFQVRDGSVWHEGVAFGLPRVHPDLVIRTSGSVSFAEQLDLTIAVPIPLQLIGRGVLAEAVTDRSLTLHAGGTLANPQIEVADDDFLGNLVSELSRRLAEEEQPLQSVLQGLRERLQGDPAAERTAGENDELSNMPFLDRLRERRQDRGGPLRRLFANPPTAEADEERH